MELQQIAQDNIGFTRQVVAKDLAGNNVVLVDMYASLIANGDHMAINYSFNIQAADIVKANFDAVQKEVDKFKEEVRAKAISLGLVAL